jgi:flagellar biosynthesis component FlhA
MKSANTSQLVTIRSTDAARGAIRIAEPARFTLRFGPDGQAAIQLDCR